MDDNKKAVNADGSAATVKVGNEAVTTPAKSARELELEAKLAKSESDKEVYRAGMLAIKERNKKPTLTQEDLSNPEKVATHISETVTQELAQRDLDAKEQSDAAAVEKMRQENEELKRSLAAIQTSSGGSASYGGTGTAANVPDVRPTGYWSPEQEAILTKRFQERGYDSATVKKMVESAAEISRNGKQLSNNDNVFTKVRSH